MFVSDVKVHFCNLLGQMLQIHSVLTLWSSLGIPQTVEDLSEEYGLECSDWTAIKACLNVIAPEIIKAPTYSPFGVPILIYKGIVSP